MRPPAEWVTHEVYQMCPKHGLEKTGEGLSLMLPNPQGGMSQTVDAQFTYKIVEVESN